MIISKTPFRISFFGGGTDYPKWYRENGGATVGAAINKFCYISCRELPPFFEHKHRLVYGITENVTELEEIKHPAIREVFRFMGIESGLEIHHDGDLPARTGIGSSSAFTVGLLNALYAFKGRMVTKKLLARDAIHVEQDLIKEHVGCQDQMAAAFGGFNKFEFQQDGNIEVTPIIMKQERLENLQNHLLFLFTGFSRTASDIARVQLKVMEKKKSAYLVMAQMVNEAMSILDGEGDDLAGFGKLLHEGWKIKRGLTEKISTPVIDEIYETALRHGALGGKLIGAGGGGFMLLFAKPEHHVNLKNALKNLLVVPVRFEPTGSTIIVYQPNNSKE